MKKNELEIVNGYIAGNQEHIDIHWSQDGEKHCYSLVHTFDTVEPWYGDVDKEILKELLCRFAEQVKTKG